MMTNILHITDLHLNDPNGSEESLGSAHYREYLGGLCAKIEEFEYIPIDCVIATGDFVDKGNIRNFDHAKNVLQFLAKKLGLGNDRVAICCGNHDIVEELACKGNIEESRKAYRDFSHHFANGTPIKGTDKALLLQLSTNIYALMLDAAPETTKSMPASMSVEEENCIMNELIIDGGLEKGTLLIVGVHYPAISFPESLEAYHEENWHQRHTWSAGTALRERISNYRAGERTLWLYGETHAPDHIMVKKGSYHVITGRIGTSIKEESQLRRQVKVIHVNKSLMEPPEVLTLEYEIPTHKPQAQFGQWNGARSAIRDLSPQVSPVVVSRPRERIEVLDKGTEEVLIDKIEEKKLYSLGRFHTSEDNISLAWVSIGPLLNSKGLLCSVISGMTRWLRKAVGVEADFAKDIVLLGIDCWGAVLASEISIATGAKNFCVAARGRGKYHTSGELINDVVAEKITHYKTVVFVSDVLATGQSIKFVYDQIQEIWKAKNMQPEMRWLSLSIVMDENNNKRADCCFIEFYGTACKSLRMPIVAKGALPSEAILRPTISFS